MLSNPLKQLEELDCSTCRPSIISSAPWSTADWTREQILSCAIREKKPPRLPLVFHLCLWGDHRSKVGISLVSRGDLQLGRALCQLKEVGDGRRFSPPATRTWPSPIMIMIVIMKRFFTSGNQDLASPTSTAVDRAMQR